MLYFYLIDNQQHGHHSYWTHIPIYWLGILAFSYAIAAFFKSRFLLAAATVFIECVLLHLSLDSFAGGGIKWLRPINNTYFHIFTVSPRHSYWLWNYFLHWTALAELAIISCALFTYCKNTQKSQLIV